VRNPAGIGVTASGGIDAPEGLALDLRSSATASGALVNQGSIGGGHKLHIAAGQIGGGGTFRGDDVSFAIEGNANNPVNPVDFLQNGLHVAPANGNGVTLRLVAFGPQAQFLNVQLLGDAVLSMAYSWPSDLPTLLPLPRNHFPAIPYAQPPIANATYGGGSLIVQAAGSLTIDGGYVNNNFVFAGGIALIAGGALDINAVQFDNGWSTNGTPFQGVFFEAPLIKSSYGNINVVTSNNQWVNFSTLPVGTAAYIQQLRPDAGGYPGYEQVENAAHVNAFSQITAIAAAGGCWICAVNTTPVTLHP
jgi:hypothetical protein